jgi:Na+/phosphate symporter
MTSPSLKPEQEAKLTEALEIARLLEQQSKVMSERATEIADKYYKRRHEAAIAAQQSARDA